ncbi:MAG: carboxymuconolactone decarboxylase family protein [Betaproteobacteria bacterium]|nr:carboxymuconolactone decarboxylase family protein [Betaproteobacteria bacterium]
MSKRIQIPTQQETAYQAMLGLEHYLAGTTLATALKELIKIRASMLNNCAYCIQMHTTEALKLGEDPQRLFALAAWPESPLFSSAERAVLAMTDEVTQIGEAGLSDATYQEVLEHLGEKALAEAIMQVVVINAWNRIAVACQMIH